ncbi:glycoside hydrolase family 37 [Rhodothermus marinus SG0.5JP17-172]|uniref:amylo-alpha-1,6-glucosidase n=1 Tax=Rhodothermus marinus TaxID=29549 RepID=UPI000223D987|nr:trehalase family glycosidase [Rhodothermus marinus]AEN72445.1 glycoside hydrolase family 37 [Rhodothermus marinus SG0.5JP17-172]MBO2492188.1 glycoside hydrolase [Rhodothermus marinus]
MRTTTALREQACQVLEANWTGRFTKPAPRLYPHQWSWDAAFIALGWMHENQERAQQELRHLFRAQWKNGLVPHIVFHRRARGYFPGPGVWETHRSPDAPARIATSGIVQPPVHATAAWAMYRQARDRRATRAFLEELFPKLMAWHDYLFRERDYHSEGLVYIRHPWESGMDNAPLWDGIEQRMHLNPGDRPRYRRVDTTLVAEADRPTGAEYDRYLYLVRLFAEAGYDEARLRESCPFLVEDVLFNTLICQAEQDLAEIAAELGDDPEPFRQRARRVAEAVNRKLWDDRRALYFDYDLVLDRPIWVRMAACFTPLFAGIPDGLQAARLVSHLEASGFFNWDGSCYSVPSYDPNGLGFSPVQYWRGPVWININWLLIEGLARYGYTEHAAHLCRTVRLLVERNGFYEYYHPYTGEGHGSEQFSWTAALVLDLLARRPEWMQWGVRSTRRRAVA